MQVGGNDRKTFTPPKSILLNHGFGVVIAYAGGLVVNGQDD